MSTLEPQTSQQAFLMNSATGSPQRTGSVLALFLLPHFFLDLATDGDTPELRGSKARRNKAWLLRWLPTDLQRWALMFLVFWLMAALSPLLELPLVLGWAFEFAQYFSACVTVGLTTLYLKSRLAPF